MGSKGILLISSSKHYLPNFLYKHNYASDFKSKL